MYYLDGDLNQMATQMRFLRQRVFNVGQSNVYPTLHTEEDFKRALQAIFISRIAGWWNYHKDLVKYEICTDERFRKALDF